MNPSTPDELTLLKERATAMGIAYSPNIGLETLKGKINAKLLEDQEPEQASEQEAEQGLEQESVAAAPPPPVARLSPAEQMVKLRREQRLEQMKLVRIRISNLNPIKKDLRGEIFTVANAIIGTVRKYVPYGEESDAGYHVPYIIYNELKDRKFVSIKTRKGLNGKKVIEQRLVPEFAIEVLPPLTQEELAQLAAHQAASAGME